MFIKQRYNNKKKYFKLKLVKSNFIGKNREKSN